MQGYKKTKNPWPSQLPPSGNKLDPRQCPTTHPINSIFPGNNIIHPYVSLHCLPNFQPYFLSHPILSPVHSPPPLQCAKLYFTLIWILFMGHVNWIWMLLVLPLLCCCCCCHCSWGSAGPGLLPRLSLVTMMRLSLRSILSSSCRCRCCCCSMTTGIIIIISNATNAQQHSIFMGSAAAPLLRTYVRFLPHPPHLCSPRSITTTTTANYIIIITLLLLLSCCWWWRRRRWRDDKTWITWRHLTFHHVTRFCITLCVPEHRRGRHQRHYTACTASPVWHTHYNAAEGMPVTSSEPYRIHPPLSSSPLWTPKTSLFPLSALMIGISHKHVIFRTISLLHNQNRASRRRRPSSSLEPRVVTGSFYKKLSRTGRKTSCSSRIIRLINGH